MPNENIIISGTGVNRTAAITPEVDQIGEATITLRVSDGALTNSTAFVLSVLQRTPGAPTNIVLSSATVPENSSNGFVVGTFTAIDPDSTNHVFALLDSAGGRFSVQGSDLLVEAGALLDFETASSHEILVSATDSDNLSFSKTLIIQVLNVNEAPTFNVVDNSILETVTGLDTPMTRLQVGDPDAGTNSVSLRLQVTHGILTINSNLLTTVTNNGTSDVTLSGSLTNLNVLLESIGGLLYRATALGSGTDLLTATLDDKGHTGLGTNQVIFTTLGIRFYRSAYEQWLHAVFSEEERNDSTLEATVWGVHADPDGDGIENLAEYALGTSAREPDAKPASSFIMDGDKKYLSLEINCRRDPNLRLSVEVAGDIAAGTWSSADSDLKTFAPIDLNDGFERVRFDDRTATSDAERRFLRMRWTLENEE